MSELFINPASMAAGAALISAPIIIHLINRMRFKRIRWAAMEFLLKAQKRMKRKMIIEQLLLLLLRCLLILLLGLLVGRFLGCSGDGRDTRTTAHVVVVDDTPSTADGWRADDGNPTTAFDQAKKVVVEQIAPAAAQATTVQTLHVILLSDLAKPAPAGGGYGKSFGRINATSIEEAKKHLDQQKPATVRVPLAEGLKQAKAVLDGLGEKNVAQVVHVVGDFRDSDWVLDGDPIKQAVTDLTTAKVKVHLTDVVHPFRKSEGGRALLSHDNVGITELRATKLVVAKGERVTFTLRVKNFGGSELKDQRFVIKVNGDEAKGLSVSFPTLPGKTEEALQFELNFDRVGTEDKPLDRFSLVTAELAGQENGGIAADNVRHAVVEVRDRLPILIVEGRPNMREKKEGDSFYVRRIFTSVQGGFLIENATPADLATKDLRPFTSIFLLNVPGLPEAAVANLEKYARDGGGVAFFLGPDVKPADYKALYRDGAGLFPVPLPEKPTEPLTPEKRSEALYNFQKKFLLRDAAAKAHPVLRELYLDERGRPTRDDKFDNQLLFFTINQYWPVKRIGQWRDDRNVSELYCLPNDQPMANFDAPVAQLYKTLDELFTMNPELDAYKKLVLLDPGVGAAAIKRLSLTSEPVYKLAAGLDRLLSDQRGEGDAIETTLREFWALPKAADAKALAAQLRDAAKFGDPIYLAKKFGRGRVTAFLSTAGETWTDWPTGAGGGSFVPIVTELEKYLSGAGADDNAKVGDAIEFRVPAGQYKPGVKRAFLTHDSTKVSAKAGGDLAPVVDLKEQVMTADGDKLVLRFAEDLTPGAYLFTLTNLRAGTGAASQPAEEPEYRAVAVNIDTPREGDLKRASTDDIKSNAPNADLHSLDDAAWLDKIKNKQSDLSESGWMFLALLLLLVAEQAMAVRLSYHASPTELEGTAPSAAAAMHTSVRTTAGAAEPEPTPAA